MNNSFHMALEDSEYVMLLSHLEDESEICVCFHCSLDTAGVFI